MKKKNQSCNNEIQNIESQKILIFGQQEDREEPGFMHWWRLLKKLENFGY
jgi:hypothetical protein